MAGHPQTGRSGLLEINPFRYRDGVTHIHAQIAHRAFKLGVVEQALHGAQNAGFPIHPSGFGPAQGMCAIGRRVGATPGEAGICFHS